jgi:hypothetical protein
MSNIMSHARRIVAALLVIAMMPSTLLAAMPISYCVGPAGHQALEFVFGSVHSGDHSSHDLVILKAVDCDITNTASFFVHEGKCTDRALIDTASTAPPLDVKRQSVSALVGHISVSGGALSQSALDRVTISYSYHQKLLDPRMNARRTVVLLI